MHQFMLKLVVVMRVDTSLLVFTLRLDLFADTRSLPSSCCCYNMKPKASRVVASRPAHALSQDLGI